MPDRRTPADDARTVAQDLLALIERAAGIDPLPPVARLHLPLDADENSHEAEFCGLELADGSIGLSFLMLGDTFAALRAANPAAMLQGMPALDLARWFLADEPARRTIGFAAINAISQRLLHLGGVELDTATDSIGLLDPRPGDRVGMVGLFTPLVPRIVEAGADLTVLELQEHLAGEREGWRVTLDPGELAGCTKVLSTTTILLNDTLDRVISACRGARYLALVGPGGGCLPDPLFARGVTLLGGTRIVDRDGFATAIARGESWGRYARKYCITRDRYPGVEAILAAIGARRPAR